MKIFSFFVGRSSFTVLLIASAVVFAACSSNDDNGGGEPTPEPEPVAPILTVTPTGITAAAAAGTYNIGVTSNTTWTATVNTGATWCSLSSTTGDGNGTVTVSVAANSVIVTRAATVTITAATNTLTERVTVAQDAMPETVTKFEDPDSPPFAASDNVWSFSSSALAWSDAIHAASECDKSLFGGNMTTSACRSYRSSVGDTVFFYYNWPYVDANAATLCPSPWRVPTYDDFVKLRENVTPATLIDEWGFGGVVWGEPSGVNQISAMDNEANYWSADEDLQGTAWGMKYYKTELGVSAFVNVSDYTKHYGFQMRCVK
jgi:hypothetical protein